MRIAMVIAALGVAALVDAGSPAQAAPWCGNQGAGPERGSGFSGVTCNFYTFESCVYFMRPFGGSCIPNPDGSALRQGYRYGYYDDEPPPVRHKKKRRHYR